MVSDKPQRTGPVTPPQVFETCASIMQGLIDDAIKDEWRKGYAKGWDDAMHHILCAVEKLVPIIPPTVPIEPSRRPRRNGLLELVRDAR